MGIRITCCLRYHLLELSNDFVHNIQPFCFSVDDSNQLPGGGFKYFLVCSPPFGEDSHFDYPPEVFTVRPWKYTGPQKEAGSFSFQPSIFSGAFAVKFRGCHILNMVQHDLTKLGWLEIPNCNLASICGHWFVADPMVWFKRWAHLATHSDMLINSEMICLFFERPPNFEAWGAVCFSWTWASMPPVWWWSMWFSLILLLHRGATLVACNKNTCVECVNWKCWNPTNLKHVFFDQFGFWRYEKHAV